LLLDPSERPPELAAYRVVPPVWAVSGLLGGDEYQGRHVHGCIGAYEANSTAV